MKYFKFLLSYHKRLYMHYRMSLNTPNIIS